MMHVTGTGLRYTSLAKDALEKEYADGTMECVREALRQLSEEDDRFCTRRQRMEADFRGTHQPLFAESLACINEKAESPLRWTEGEILQRLREIAQLRKKRK
jgi:DNA topoisomerase VI subunit B